MIDNIHKHLLVFVESMMIFAYKMSDRFSQIHWFGAYNTSQGMNKQSSLLLMPTEWYYCVF